MNEIEKIYKENNLLVRAMNMPSLGRNNNEIVYDCTIWTNEFSFMKNESFSSVSTTLIISNIGISTYKNMGYLIDSSKANCFHISKTDSSSSGNRLEGNFLAGNQDFQSIAELANFIIENNWREMNEVNADLSLNSVVGLFINKCFNQEKLLERILIAQKCLEDMLEIKYPIYLYDSDKGTLEKIELSKEIEEEMINHMRTTQMFYWPDECEFPIIKDIGNEKNKLTLK